MIVFRPELAKVRIARDHVAEITTDWPVNEYFIRLVASELVTNAVRHAATEMIRVHACAGEGVYVIEVWDADRRPPVPAAQPLCPESPGGRGLWIVTDCADRWGVRHDDDDGGKVVYAQWTRP
ncbi:ATP-binding protein [Actinomadura sp. NPDC048955]|uniref:ATP-binding protein n=1 Tax=Actinomadura sp. NPDC048955 TaxID=3158228 RepID=UPI0033EB17BD